MNLFKSVTLLLFLVMSWVSLVEDTNAVDASAEGTVVGQTRSTPNIVIILADDLGWRDVGYHESEIRTPNIDRIAREGVELDRFYVQPSCSPTRAALMTGKSPQRLGITKPIGKNNTSGLPLTEKVLPEYLAEFGYQTAMVGKWHLGHHNSDYLPNARGFEHFYGNVTGGIGYWDHNHGGGHDWQRNGVTLREEGYSTALLSDEAVRVLETRDKNRPLFLYLAFNAPHLPNEAPKQAIEKYRHLNHSNRRTHAAMVDVLDRAIGRVIRTLEKEEMLNNTIIFFSSDNGGLVPATGALGTIARSIASLAGRPLPSNGLEFLATNILDGGSNNGLLTNGKTSVYEGGVRVPAAIWWPGKLGGRVHMSFMSVSDVLPTLIEAVGKKHRIPHEIDGQSQWQSLTRGSKGNHSDYLVDGMDGVALYRMPWKLTMGSKTSLFNIVVDPYELNDVAGQHQKIVDSMLNRIQTWPRMEREESSIIEYILDPDSFGGGEDRKPWADQARERTVLGVDQ